MLQFHSNLHSSHLVYRAPHTATLCYSIRECPFAKDSNWKWREGDLAARFSPEQGVLPGIFSNYSTGRKTRRKQPLWVGRVQEESSQISREQRCWEGLWEFCLGLKCMKKSSHKLDRDRRNKVWAFAMVTVILYVKLQHTSIGSLLLRGQNAAQSQAGLWRLSKWQSQRNPGLPGTDPESSRTESYLQGTHWPIFCQHSFLEKRNKEWKHITEKHRPNQKRSVLAMERKLKGAP